MAKRVDSDERSKRYRIGKGRPPRATRWKPGQSGNPKGRPKGRKNLRTIVKDVLDQKINVQENGQTRSMASREAIVKRLRQDALKGDLKAASYLFGYEPDTSENLPSIPEQTSNQDPYNANAAAEAYFRVIKGGRQ